MEGNCSLRGARGASGARARAEALAKQSDSQRPLQITDVVSAQPLGGASRAAAGAPSVNSAPLQGADADAAGGATISSMNDHLQASRSAEGKRAWPERLSSNKAEAERAFDSRMQSKAGEAGADSQPQAAPTQQPAPST